MRKKLININKIEMLHQREDKSSKEESNLQRRVKSSRGVKASIEELHLQKRNQSLKGSHIFKRVVKSSVKCSKEESKLQKRNQIFKGESNL